MAVKIFSPSQTSRYLRCPVLRQLEKEGWLPRRVGKGELAAILGSAVAAGVASYHDWRMFDSLEVDVDAMYSAAHMQALTEMSDRISEIVELGREIPSWEQSYFDSIPARVVAAVDGYIDAAPIPNDWSVLAVEHTLESGSRLDLAVREADGRASVVDLKTKLTRKRGDTDDVLARPYEVSDQLYHYAWEYGQEIGEVIERAYIFLLVIEPRPEVVKFPITLTPRRRQTWIQSAERHWQDMADEDGDRLAAQNRESCTNPWGRCEFWDACHVYYYDEALMESSGYVRRVRE